MRVARELQAIWCHTGRLMRLTRGTIIATIICCVSFADLCAQEDYHSPLRSPHWNAATYSSWGKGFSASRDVELATFGGMRVGRVMTHMIGGGLTGSTFELDAELIPVEMVYWGGYRRVRGFAFNPLIMKWNFVGVRSRRMAPFVLLSGGVLATAHDVPPGKTSDVNFVSGGGVGVHVFTRPRQAFSFDARVLHISNAGLSRHNPGINASVQFTVGYTWFKK